MINWVWQVARKANSIEFIAPGFLEEKLDESAIPILKQWGSWNVWGGLRRAGARILNHDGQVSLAQATASDELASAYVPFKFFDDRRDFESINRMLGDLGHQKSVFGKDRDFEFIRTGGLTKVIVEELGKNVFDHAEGKNGFMSIGKMHPIRESDPDLRRKLLGRLKAVPSYAESFFENLGTDACIEVVISDLGRGIPSTIKKPYLEDAILEKKKSEPKDDDLIKYAYLLHSTSKPSSYYTTSSDYPYPHGLFFVKAIARRFRGLLVCRSGNSKVAWDFYSSKDAKPITAKKRSKRINFPRIGGTQIQLLVPLHDKKLTKSRVFLPDTFIGEVEELQTEILAVSNLDKTNRVPDEKEVLKAVHSIANRSTKPRLIVLDFIGVDWGKDQLFPVVSDLRRLALTGIIFGLVNTEHQRMDAAIDAMFSPQSSSSTKINSRPVVRLRNVEGSWELDLVGSELSEGELKTFEKAIAFGQPVDYLPEELEHLFKAGIVNENEFIPKIDIANLTSELDLWREKRIKEIILSEPFGVVHYGKFILPNGLYVDRFYEIDAILRVPFADRLIGDTLAKSLTNTTDGNTLVVCISRIGKKLGEVVGNYLRESLDCFQFCFVEDVEKVPFFRFPNGNFSRIAILTDAIASGDSVDAAISAIERSYPSTTIAIYTVIDCRPKKLQGVFVHDKEQRQVYAVVSEPNTFHPQKPSGWKYSEIKRIDHVNWRPIHDLPHDEEQYEANQFLSNHCSNSNAIRIGHFHSSNGNHYRFFFSTSHLVNSFSQEFAGRISEAVQKTIGGKLETVTHIITPDDSVGLEKMLDKLKMHLKGTAKIVKVNRETDTRTYTTDESDVVLVFDSACSTTRTAQRLVDVARQLEPKLILVWFLMSRANEDAWRYLTGVDTFRKIPVEVNTLTRVNVPVYAKGNRCPICERKKLINRASNKRFLNRLGDALIRETLRLNSNGIRALRDREHIGIAEYSDRISKFRMLLERQRSSSSALDEILELLKSNEKANRHSILRACSDEHYDIFDTEFGLPPDLRGEFRRLAETTLETSELSANTLRSSVQVLVATAPFEKPKFLEHIIPEYGDNISAIELVLVEILIHAEFLQERFPLHETIKCLKTAQSKIIEHSQQKSVHPETLSILSEIIIELNQQVEVKRVSHFGAHENCSEVIKILTNRMGGTHAYIQESLTLLGMLADPEHTRRQLDELYYGENGLSELLLKQLLPRNNALAPLYETLEHPRGDYLLRGSNPSFENDCRNLATIMQEVQAIADNPISKPRDILDAVKRDKTIARLKKWTGRSTDWINILKDCFCDPINEINAICKFWERTISEKHIKFHLDLPSSPVECFIAKRTIKSIVHSTIDNSFKYGFSSDKKSYDKLIFIEVSSDENYVTLTMGDNGIGKKDDEDAGVSRINERCSAFDGRASFYQSEKIATGIQIQLLRRSAQDVS